MEFMYAYTNSGDPVRSGDLATGVIELGAFEGEILQLLRVEAGAPSLDQRRPQTCPVQGT